MKDHQIQIKKEVEKCILELDPIKGIDFLLGYSSIMKRDDENILLVIKAEYLNKKRDYQKGIVGQKGFDRFKTKFNFRLLGFVDSLHFNSDQIKGETNKVEEVLFKRSQIILKIVHNSEMNLLVFKTTYFENRLFVQNNFFGNSRIFNFLKYHKKFPFVINNSGKENAFILVVNFSVFSGLISNYSLIKGDKVLQESSL